jgi:hypothetical protein
MTPSTTRALLACLLVPLCGFSCTAFREFQVRPHLGDPSASPVSVGTLVDDYRRVATAVSNWANERGLTEKPCRYYSSPTATKPATVEGFSPGCQIFDGQTYTVRTEFTPSLNSTRVSVLSSTHAVADHAARILREYLASTLGPKAISEYGGGEMPNNAMDSDTVDSHSRAPYGARHRER